MELCSDGARLVIGARYGYVGNEARTSGLLREVASNFTEIGLPRVLLGDFNLCASPVVSPCEWTSVQPV